MERAFLTFWLALILGLGSPAAAYSQIDQLAEMNLEQLMQIEISTASKYRQPSSEAPSSVSVITRNELELLGYRTLSEVIRGVRGFHTTNDRTYNYTGARGFGRPADYDTRLLVMLNGHRLNESVYDSATLGLDLIVDIGLIDRVEIVRGPSSSLYGTNAFFGVINIITRPASQIDGAEVSGSAGSFDSYRGRASYGGVTQDGTEIVLSASRFDSRGEPHTFFENFLDTPSGGIARHLDGEEGGSFYSNFKSGEFTLHSGFVTRAKNSGTAAYGTLFNDPRFENEDQRFFANLGFHKVLTEDLELKSALYYDRYDYDGTFPYDISEAADGSETVITKDFSRGERWGATFELLVTALERQKIVVGAELRDNFRVDQKVHDLEPYFSYLDDRRDLQSAAAYLQDEITLSDSLKLQIGARVDKYEGLEVEISPRTAMIFQADESTSLKLLAGRAFRAPNAFELFYDDGGVTLKRNPSLEPEEIFTYEAVVARQLTDRLLATLDLYHYRIEDLISQEIDGDGLAVFRNRDEAEASGIELELEALFMNGLRLKTSYAYQEAEEQESGARLTNSPLQMWKNQFIVPLYADDIFAGVELLYTSKRNSTSGVVVSDYWLTNLTVTYRELLKDLTLSGSIYNLLDEDYSDPGAAEHPSNTIPQYGRTWQIKLDYKF